jgi:arylsulfatase
MCAHEDFIPTFAAAAGEPDLVEKCRKGHSMGDRTFKVHLDGHNLIPFLSGSEKKSPRPGFPYWSDDGDLVAVRVGDLKVSFKEQHHSYGPETPLGVWQAPFSTMRQPNIYHMRSDPFERATDSILYSKWQADHVFYLVPIQGVVAKYLESFKAFPPRCRLASFSVDQVMQNLTEKAR